jgi:nucleoside-diphosphate-sugar epimerase
MALDSKTAENKIEVLTMTIGKKTILVTGGCGFIGSHLVEALVHGGYRVRVLDNLSTGKLENIAHLTSQNVEVLVEDIADFPPVEAAMKGCEYVFHEAAIASVPQSIIDPRGTAKVNYGGTINVLEAARNHGVRRVVFAGSAAVYGDEPTLPKNESMPANPITPYGVDKLASELMGHFYARTLGLEFVSLRYFNVFGPRQNSSSPYSGAISIFCDCIRQGIPPVLYGDGLQSRDFIQVADVVAANLLVMEHPKATGRTFNVGRGVATSLIELIDELNDLTGKNLQPIHQQSRAGDIRHSLADPTALKALGWSPTISIRQGLKELLQSDF